MDSLPDISMDITELVEEQVEEKKIEEDNEEVMQELEKPKLSQAQIFQDPPVMKKVNEPKKKRVLSEEHKAKLAHARVKALETRRANAALRKEEKELTTKIKHKKIQQLREQVDETPRTEAAPIPVSKPINIPQPRSAPVGYSQADLEAVALNAILGHEKLRKNRKAKKKEDEEVTRQQMLLKQQLRNATTAPPKPQYYSKNGVWDSFF